jgi:hypothetical protein
MNEAAIAALAILGTVTVGYTLMALCYLRNQRNRR